MHDYSLANTVLLVHVTGCRLAVGRSLWWPYHRLSMCLRLYSVRVASYAVVHVSGWHRARCKKMWGVGGRNLYLCAWVGGRVCVNASLSLPSTPPVQLVRSAMSFYDHRNRPYLHICALGGEMVIFGR